MAEETREQKARRLKEEHIRDRNIDLKSMSEYYSKNDFGIELDPDYHQGLTHKKMEENEWKEIRDVWAVLQLTITGRM